MPFVPVPSTVAVEMRMRLDNQSIENTLYFRLLDDFTSADLLILGGDLIAWWGDHYAEQTSDQVQLVEVVCTDLTTATSPSVTSVPAVGAFGNVDSPFLPMNVALAVSFRTASRGRSFRGRNYFAGLTEIQVAGNEVEQSVADAIQDIYELMLPGGSIFTNDWVWSVVSRFSGVDGDGKPIPRTTGLATRIDSVVVVDRTIDSMRRRLPGRGR